MGAMCLSRYPATHRDCGFPSNFPEVSGIGAEFTEPQHGTIPSASALNLMRYIHHGGLLDETE